MMNPLDFYDELKLNGIDFFTGVPDSLLKDICSVITEKTIPEKNIIAANEGNSVAIACGYYLATEKIPLVYMQNSGMGNAINPILSLADKEVYSIPMLLLIGWRGEPGEKDEPQHIKQGKVTIPLLKAMNIEYEIMPQKFNDVKNILKKIFIKIRKNQAPYALIIKKNTFSKYVTKPVTIEVNIFSREDALKCVIDSLNKSDIVVSTTGKLSRELFEYRTSRKDSHKKDFLTVGSMGHASQIALGIALEKKDKNVYCLDGDGAAIMHLGGLGIIGDLKPQNFKHIIFNNGSHESVGGQPTIGKKISFNLIAKELKYKETYSVSSKNELISILPKIKESDGPILLEIIISNFSRKDLGRPTTSPSDNKNEFITFLKE